MRREGLIDNDSMLNVDEDDDDCDDGDDGKIDDGVVMRMWMKKTSRERWCG